MLYYLSLLSGHLTGLNLFRYTTFRAGLAAALAFLFCLLLGRRMITALYRLKLGQQVRTGAEWEAIHHAGKAGTPTMGGVLILAACTTASLLCCHPSVPQCHLALATLLYMGGVGFLDDFLKIRKKQNEGLTVRQKFALEILLAVLIAVLRVFKTARGTMFWIPFWHVNVDFG